MQGYCAKHNRAFEIKRIPNSWIYECPQCRNEWLLNVYTSNKTNMLPESEWTISNKIGDKNER